ncbi:GDP-mannose 4,6-dehydratase [Paracoccaceae bacterium]|nr:GDP-mannose 4,6-dehydratase [Paracoccaceae bacterium]
MKKTAIISGISGQDGGYLAAQLLQKGYYVIGTSRNAEVNKFTNLRQLGIRDDVTCVSMDLSGYHDIKRVIEKYRPCEIYHLGGQTSVGSSFIDPIGTFESISTSNIFMLEAIRNTDPKIKFYNACSSECFGDNSGVPAVEDTPFSPKSPYAVAKCSAFWQAKNYRESYGLFACSGILFNHESPLRPEKFVTKKIIQTACRISKGSSEKLQLGNINVIRDWGYAPDYVDAMYRILQYSQPTDFIIATGDSYSLQDFLVSVFDFLNLDWKQHVIVDENIGRLNELTASYGNPQKAFKLLGWRAKIKKSDLVKKLVEAELGGDKFWVSE